MTQRTPTPGPWHVIVTNRIRSCKVVMRANKVATVWWHPLGDMAANARLIAATPDLLAACKAARSALDKLMGDSDLDEDNSPEFIAMQMLSAAIDMAEDWRTTQ